MTNSTRREMLKTVGLVAAGALVSTRVAPTIAAPATQPQARPRVAVVMTAFYRRSHAHVILENFLEPYLFNGRPTDPGVDVVSFFVEQVTARDMSREVAAKYRIPVFPTIDAALCLGGKELAVDAVLIIAEHGDYPTNAKGQTEYPRKRFFDEVVKVFERSGCVVPVFNDKHLSYRWDWAKEMYDTARKMKIPLMAGSSVPLAERRPPLGLEPGAKLRDAVSIHSGPLEAYGYHALEVMQSMVEARAGGETGVRQVRFLAGPALWQAAKDGVWSPEVAAAAMAAELGPDDPLTRSVTLDGKTPAGAPVDTNGILVRYNDGLNGIALTVSRNSSTRWNFACREGDSGGDSGGGAPKATAFFVGPWQNRCLFKALAHAIQTHFRQKRSPYPVERTLLVTGVLAAAMDSFAEKGRAIDTPHLAIRYAPRDYRAMREMGASWKIITEKTKEPEGIERVGL